MDKKLIYEKCISLLEDKITSVRQSMDDARDASNNDTKSSMGDKYETTREMMQIELDKLGKQLQDAQQMLLGLKVLNPEKRCEVVESGSLVTTDRGVFYFSVPLGKVVFYDQVVMAISPSSPIGKAMLGKKKNSHFTINSATYHIQEIQ